MDIFLQKLDRFRAALAARYDGNPNVAARRVCSPCQRLLCHHPEGMRSQSLATVLILSKSTRLLG